MVSMVGLALSNRILRASLWPDRRSCQDGHCTVWFGVENQNAEDRQESFQGFQCIIKNSQLNLPLHGSDVFDHSKWSCTMPGMLTCIDISQGEP